jgi:hypothetical protein
LDDRVSSMSDAFPEPGGRVRLFGGSDPDPAYLGGRDAIFGTVLDCMPGQGTEPALIVELDEPLSVGEAHGEIAVLQLRYDGALWGPTGVVHIELCSELPPMVRWQDREQQGAWVESSARFEVVPQP